MYMSKSLINHLFLEKELYQLKIYDGGDIRDHLNYFTKLFTQLSNIGMKVDDECNTLLTNYYHLIYFTLFYSNNNWLTEYHLTY